MVGRNGHVIADALQALAQAMGNQNRGEVVGDAEYQGLDRFQQNNPSAFNGGCNLNKKDITSFVAKIKSSNNIYDISEHPPTPTSKL